MEKVRRDSSQHCGRKYFHIPHTSCHIPVWAIAVYLLFCSGKTNSTLINTSHISYDVQVNQNEEILAYYMVVYWMDQSIIIYLLTLDVSITLWFIFILLNYSIFIHFVFYFYRLLKHLFSDAILPTDPTELPVDLTSCADVENVLICYSIFHSKCL